MKNTRIICKLVLLALAAGLVFSCAKQYVSPSTDAVPGEEDGTAEVIFQATDSSNSKATGISAEDESTFGRWAVFAFDDHTGHFKWSSSEGGEPISMNLICSHSYTCFAITNYPVSGVSAFKPGSVKSAADIYDKVAYLGDNSEGSLLMFGSDGFIMPESSGDGTPISISKTITVQRTVSRLDVPGIRVDFSEAPSLASKTFTLRAIYITNAYRTSRYGADYSANELSSDRSSWYNTGGWHRGENSDGGMDALLGDLNINSVITKSAPYNVMHSFYVFPNATEKADDDHQMDAWTRRCTRIVIEATLDDETMYYQITAPSLERNRIYTAKDVVIRGRGSRDPEVIDMEPDIEYELEIYQSSQGDGDWQNPVSFKAVYWTIENGVKTTSVDVTNMAQWSVDGGSKYVISAGTVAAIPTEDSPQIAGTVGVHASYSESDATANATFIDVYTNEVKITRSYGGADVEITDPLKLAVGYYRQLDAWYNSFINGFCVSSDKVTEEAEWTSSGTAASVSGGRVTGVSQASSVTITAAAAPEGKTLEKSSAVLQIVGGSGDNWDDNWEDYGEIILD